MADSGEGRGAIGALSSGLSGVLGAAREAFSRNAGRTPIWLALAGFIAALFLYDAHPWATGGLMESFIYTADDIAEYFVYAIGFFIVFWVGLDRFIRGRKLSRHRWPKPAQVISEALFSMTSQFIFLAAGIWIAFLLFPEIRRANAYRDIAEHGWAYYGLTLLLVFFVHDTFFYWFHRFMHWKPMFRLIHKTHHESRDPTPFTTFHFHPAEAVLEAAAGQATILVLLLMPWHVSVPTVWITGQIIFNSIGHCGFEIYPSWWHRVPFFSQKTTAMHHYMHHQRVSGNYALYFRFWDRVCGTEFKDYEARYDAMFQRIRDGRDGRRATPDIAPAE